MEEVPRIAGHIPPLASYPDSHTRTRLPAAEWEQYLDSWLFSIEFRLRLPDKDLVKINLSPTASGVDFLISFFRSTRDQGVASLKAHKERLLLKRAYMLLRRLLLGSEVPAQYEAEGLLDLVCLASSLYGSVADWKATLDSLWKWNKTQMTNALEGWKKNASATLAVQPDSASVLDDIRPLNALLRVSPHAGLVLMTGSDYLETLMEAYGALQATPATGDSQRGLTEHIFYCLRSLMSDGSRHSSLLLDHLYHLKSGAEQLTKSKPHQATLCSSLVCNTSFLRHLAADDSVASGKRGQDLISALTSYRQNTAHLHPPAVPRKRKVAKGKGKADPHGEMHVHKASQVSEVHDLFPDLSTRYILKLLDHFHDNVQDTIAALLEPESLPPDLRDPGSLDGPLADIDGPVHDLAPHPTPPLLPQRKNVFDGDDFDKLRISSTRLHQGRKHITVNDSGTKDTHAQRKAAIMAALAAFDSDDDERDDSYDVADVGGTVDSTLDTDNRPRPERGLDQNAHEESLFRAWKSNPELFTRDSKTRASNIRQDLKRETGMSDEQIEGWAIMLKKDARLQDRLEKKYSTSQSFGGNQTALATTRWQGDTPEDSEDGDGAGSGGRRTGQAQIRGNRTWGRGRGGNTTGPSSDASTQAARRRKEQGRGRGGANHGRREGRARKVGRGMAGPAG